MKLRIIGFLAVFAMLCGSARGQGVRFTAPILQKSTVAGVTNVATVPAAPVVAFCNAPANAVPCTNKATTYTDATLTVACSTSLQIVLDGTTTCVANPDANDNWGVWVAPGQYAYTIAIAGANLGPYFVTVGGGTACVYQGPVAALTGNAADQTYYTCTLPANFLAAGHCIRVTVFVNHSAGAANPTFRFSFGGTLTTAITPTNPTNDKFVYEACNSPGVQNVQQISSVGLDSNTGTVILRFDTAAVNTQNAVVLNATFNVANTDQVTPRMFFTEAIGQ